MTSVITVPASLDDLSFEQVLDQVAAVPSDARILVDARHCRFSTPYGLTALLTLAQTRLVKPEFAPPEDDSVLSYWVRANFFRYAEELYTVHGTVPRPRSGGGDSEQLLEVTPISKSDDIHAIVERIQQRAAEIITVKLHLEPRAVMGFAMTLSEACQNIIEHAGRGGWVAVQGYHMKKRLGRHAVVIAVCDAGIGFRQSLEARHRQPGERWSDAIALERGVIQGQSRFGDPGRGQGLKGIRSYAGRWHSKLSVRSGTARVAIVPAWDDDLPRREGLAPFPGTQLQLILPEKAR